VKKILQKLKRNKQPKIKAGQLYVVDQGDYFGKSILFVNDNPIEDRYDALAVYQGRDVLTDGFEVLSIPSKDVKEGIEKKILNFVEVLPKDIYNIFYQEWLNRKELANNKESENEESYS